VGVDKLKILKFIKQKSLQLFRSRVVLIIGFFAALGCGLSPASAQKKDETASKIDEPLICNIADFKTLALSVNGEQEREKSVNEWLNKFGKICSVDQLIYIRGNFPGWLGTANSPTLNRKVESIIGAKGSSQKNYETDLSGIDKSQTNQPSGNYSTEKMSTRK